MYIYLDDVCQLHQIDCFTIRLKLSSWDNENTLNNQRTTQLEDNTNYTIVEKKSRRQ